MADRAKLSVSHAPFWHDGSSLAERNYHTALAALPAAGFGVYQYGVPALGVLALAVATAALWEALGNRVMRRPVGIGDGSAILTGLLLGMLLPATAPWWFVTAGTFLAIVIARHLFGGLGSNVFHPVLVAVAILGTSWAEFLDFHGALLRYDLGFPMIYPLAAAKQLGAEGAAAFSAADLLLGRQSGAIGATFGAGLLVGGGYLAARGFIRWEVPAGFLAGVAVAAALFQAADPAGSAGPLFHLLTGYTLIGAFFLATEDVTSPVHPLPMLLYGLGAGVFTVVIRNIGAYVDGVVFAVLLMNVASPLLDKRRPRALGEGMGGG